jgi:hypothetical protein
MNNPSTALARLSLLLVLCHLPALADSAATISGTIVDVRGAAIPGARVQLTINGRTPDPEATTNASGQFSFVGIDPAPFRLTITAPGFAPASLSGTLAAGQALTLPPATLQISSFTTNVDVTLTQKEIAQEQVNVEEKQRLLGVLPNYYVTYDPNPAPLTSGQKFSLAWKTTYDPVSFGITAIIAGVSQSRDTYSGYGQGTEGYAKRYGAAYGDFFSGIMLGGYVFPALLHQDPRYFYKGTGTKTSRLLYALERSFICQGDNGKPEFNYSAILGGLASGGISNLYYPAKNRDGAGLTFKNAGLGIVGNAISNIVQEFFFKKLTRKPPQLRPAAVN